MRMTAVLLIAAATLTGCSRHSFDRFFTRGSQYLAAHQYAEAAIELQNAVRVNPGSSAAQIKLGEAHAALGQNAQAAAAFERACALAPANVAPCVQAASELLASGQYDAAVARARSVLAADRFNLDAQLILASAFAGVRRFADAEERLQAALAVAPQEPRIYKALGELQWQRGQTQEAEASLRRAIELDPASAGARVSLAEIYLETGRSDAGANELRAALDADPQDLSANKTYASYLVASAHCVDAEPYWQNVAAGSTDGSGALALADYYVLSGRTDDALRVLEPVTKTRTQSGAARTRIAAILYDRGQRAPATQLVDDVLTHDDSNISGLVLRARMSLDEHDTARARDLVHRAASVAPSAPAVRDLLAALSAGR